MADLRVIDAAPVGKGVVEYLEHLLSKARENKLSAIAVASVYRDGSTGSGWSELHSLSAMVGSVTALQAKLVKDMVDGDEV